MRKYEKTIDVMTAVESVLALFFVEKMSRSSVRDRPPASFFSQKGLFVHHRYWNEIRVRNSEATSCLFTPFLSNVDFCIMAKIICNREDHLMAII